MTQPKTLLVAVGASAGGLEAFSDFLSAIGNQPGFAIALVQHLDPNNKSLLPDLLRNQTSLNIEEVAPRKKIQPNTVYLCPPRGRLTVRNDVLEVSTDSGDDADTNVIDHFFHSIAETQSERGIGIILSGSGTDGTLGLKSISDAGGMTFAQDSESAKFDSMPRNAATTGVADQVMPPAEIADEVKKYVGYLNGLGQEPAKKKFEEQIKHAIPRIADALLAETGNNFKHYKVNTLARRIQRRIQVLKLSGVDEYVNLLHQDKNEPQQLFRELLISVTAFFRDPDSFETLADQVIPKLFANRQPGAPVRIWVPGCATGEEAYTIAMLCREYVEQSCRIVHPNDEPSESEAMGENCSTMTFQVFASDIDERALGIARAAVYPAGISDHVSEERLQRFFIKKGNRYHVKQQIRECVLFSSHNLISDPPYSRQDLISCRNLLIYLGPHLQKKLIPLFHYALRPSGYLLLGPSESISSHGELFRSIDSKHRISQRKGTAIARNTALTLRAGNNELTQSPDVSAMDDDKTDAVQIMQRIILDEFAPKAVVVDEDGQVICSSGEMHKYLSTGEGAFQNNLVKMARRGMRIGLRATFSEAKAKRRRITHENLSVQTDEGKQRVMITIQPMMRLGEDSGLFIVVFHDVGLPIQSGNGIRQDIRPDEAEESNVLTTSATNDDLMINQLELELSTTRNDLEKTMQEMDAANEELKSSNEELLSMNEELQSANEELETSKEEIRAGSDAVGRANADLENLLRSTRIATIFIDDDGSIRSFTPAATEIYGLIPTDVGRPLAQIVPNTAYMPPLPDRDAIIDDVADEETIVTHGGKSFIRRVLPYQNYSGEREGIVVTFTDVSQLKESEELFQLLVDASAQIVWITNAEGFVVDDSLSWRAFTGQTYDQWKGHGWLDAIHPDDRQPTISAWQRVVDTGSQLSLDYRLRHHSGDYRWTHVRAVAQRHPDGSVSRWIGMNTDIDARKHYEHELADREADLRRVIDNTIAFVGVLKPDGTLREANLPALEAAGLKREDVVGQKFWDLYWWSFSPAVQSQLKALVARAAAGESVRQDMSYRIAGDRIRTLDFMLNPVVDDDGKVTHLVPSAIDIHDRRQAEIGLAEAKARLELSLEVSGVATWNWNMETDDVISNPALNRMFGFEPDEKLTLESFVHQMDDSVRARVTAAIEDAVQKKGTYDQEYPIRLRNGEVRHVRAVGKVEGDDESKPKQFFGVVLDVTHRKNREIDIAQREAHLRRVINNQLGLVAVVDRDGMLLEVDERSLEIARSRREDVIGKPFVEAPWWNYDPAVADRIRTAMQRAFAGESVRFDVSWFADGKDGVMIDFMIAPVFDDDGAVEYLIPSGVDIRERFASEQSLKETSRRMEMALRAGGMAAWEWTPTENFWTEQLYELLGIDPNQPADSDLFFSLVHPDDIDHLKLAWQAAVDGSDTYDCEFRIIRPDGQVRWMMGQGEVVRDKSGQVVRMYGVNWDSTKEHDHAAALLDSEQRAQAASASKSEFLANMSHEIRTPMTAILGYSDLLRELVDSEEAKQHLQTIRRNGDYLLDIINDILDLSKIEAGKFDVQRERFDPTRVIEDVRSIMEVRAHESGLTLEVEYHGKMPRIIESDAKRLKQILINLVGNAIKFTQTGRVRVRTRFETDADTLHFDVIDTGIGMTQEQQVRLFKPFSQGDSSVTRHFGGTGLGLAISKRLAEMLGGEITVSSTQKVGSTFTVTIDTGPVDEELLTDHSLNEVTNASEGTAQEKRLVSPNLVCHILIVDDRRDIRFLSKRILTKAGATVDECEDGQLAVDHITAAIQAKRLPDLILLDMQMPNLDGYQTARKLRQLGYANPIIALTADAMQGDMNECLEAGCNDYLSKPIDGPRLLQLVSELTKRP
ncbi:Autoinducer 2 sensor kinase/phosphatase LuxQ [Rubripirellula obstinata]|uniref:Autoinducer 2 sensor kinase/phosphatase LuxQ n=1 Tax=Rubripirellula obstinata TaxID=406547 RepID=A0A5B1CM91_9BACT|nr:PAS domain S-box protein [Rubripirellula obstinata]KAA1261452.1 Autoinducer 2 sensor kinase/phosphatase LuxQ [Rubripirellula obstinata]